MLRRRCKHLLIALPMLMIGLRKQEDDSFEQETETPQREEADKAGGSRNSESEHEMLALDTLIRRIVKEGKKSIREKEVLKVDADDQSYGHSKPRRGLPW